MNLFEEALKDNKKESQTKDKKKNIPDKTNLRENTTEFSIKALNLSHGSYKKKYVKYYLTEELIDEIRNRTNKYQKQNPNMKQNSLLEYTMRRELGLNTKKVLMDLEK